MHKHNPHNERIKRQYFAFLKEAKRQSIDAVDAAAMALARFEAFTRYRHFKAFHFEQAIAFKRHLASQDSRTTGYKLSKATLNSMLAHLKRFFQWLSDKPGYKSRLQYSDAEYFNLSEKDVRVANARRTRPVPTLDQIRHVLATMPSGSVIDLRNRAVVAFTLLTGARDSATASLQIKHIDLISGSVSQDAREVKTKFSKTFTTHFFPVGDEARQIFTDWITYLQKDLLWVGDDPLFPTTKMAVNSARKFEAVGLERKHWSTATPIRTIFKVACEHAGLPYFNPHSLRNTLVRLGEKICQTPEHFKAWSQNLGHEGVLTTFSSYGEVGHQRQGEIIQSLGVITPVVKTDAQQLAKELFHHLASNGLVLAHSPARA